MRRRDARARGIEGLDGLRALAIVGVLVYHLNASWLPGGFLGVDVFFVVSGFLITTLLAARAPPQRPDRPLAVLGAARAPAAARAASSASSTSVLIARAVSQDLLVDIGRQIVGALTFSTNWLEITAGTSYFDQTAPQLFMNFWSLAVEEQFYLLWPLRDPRAAGGVEPGARRAWRSAVGVASSLLMALLFTPGTDATRVYYGTDTHVVGLMAGAALAFAWASPHHARQQVRRRARGGRVVERHEEDDRPVPEVDGVGPGPDPGRHRMAHDPLDRGARVAPVRPPGRRSMRPMTRTAVARDAATIPPRKVSVDCSSRKTISASRTPRARGTAYDPNRPQRGRRHPRRQVRGGPREGERRAEHQPHDVGVGAVVDAGGVGARGEEQRP